MQIVLKGFYLSDLTEGSGSYLFDKAWRGEPLNLHRTESWPHQGKPPPGMWDTWKIHLKKHFLQRGRRLKTNLGAWKEWDPSWQWYSTPRDNSLF